MDEQDYDLSSALSQSDELYADLFNGQDGSAQPITNGGPPAPPASTNVISQQSVPLQGGNLDSDSSVSQSFIRRGWISTKPQQLNFQDVFGEPGHDNTDNTDVDVLQDFDFDSFLSNDGESVHDYHSDSTLLGLA